MSADDVLIIGGGVIGLSMAYELATHGARVRVLERGEVGRESSWAGAGILPPGTLRQTADSYAALVAMGHRLHEQWARRLAEETGIDNGYRRSGGLRVARDHAAAELLSAASVLWHELGIRAESVREDELAELEPALADRTGREPLTAVWYLPDEAQVRNPWHMRALLAACGRLGVEIETGTPVENFELRDGRVAAVRTMDGRREAARYCVAGGAWSGQLLNRLGITLGVRPIRGQIVMLRCFPGSLNKIVNEGPRYIVPRTDGRVLIGSTEEDVGFDKRTTAEAVRDLIQLGQDLVPHLAEAEVERCWAGLRPGTADDYPYMGQVPGYDNVFVAAGHFRAGLQLSPATAVVMRKLVDGGDPEIDMSIFRLDRS